MSALDKANKQTKKTYGKSVDSVKEIHKEINKYVDNRTKQAVNLYNQTASNVSGANSALQEQLRSDSSINRNNATDEQQRLGVAGAGMGSYDADSGFVSQLADKAGDYELQNIRSERGNMASIHKLYDKLNRQQRTSALEEQKDIRNQGYRLNKESYDRMKSFQNSFTPYGGGGGGFTPYGNKGPANVGKIANTGVLGIAAGMSGGLAKTRKPKGLASGMGGAINNLAAILKAAARKQNAKQRSELMKHYLQ